MIRKASVFSTSVSPEFCNQALTILIASHEYNTGTARCFATTTSIMSPASSGTERLSTSFYMIFYKGMGPAGYPERPRFPADVYIEARALVGWSSHAYMKKCSSKAFVD